MKKFLAIYVCMYGAITFPMAQSIVNKDGMLSDSFKHKLESTGLKLNEGYILSVNSEMEQFFQTDLEYYKKGNRPSFVLQYDNAVKYLNLDDEVNSNILPRTPANSLKKIDAILPCGVWQTLYLRVVQSLKMALGAGYKIDTIHFSCRKSEESVLQEALNGTHASGYFNEMPAILSDNNIKVELYIDDSEKDIFENNLHKISKHITQDYIIIVNEVLAEKFEAIATRVLGSEFLCHGVSSYAAPWKEKMKFYGYLEAANEDEKEATIRWALSGLNFDARKLNEAVRNYIKSQDFKD